MRSNLQFCRTNTLATCRREPRVPMGYPTRMCICFVLPRPTFILHRPVLCNRSCTIFCRKGLEMCKGFYRHWTLNRSEPCVLSIPCFVLCLLAISTNDSALTLPSSHPLEVGPPQEHIEPYYCSQYRCRLILLMEWRLWVRRRRGRKKLMRFLDWSKSLVTVQKNQTLH